MNRREFLECAAILVSGAAAPRLAFALSAEQQRFLAASADYTAADRAYLSEAQQRIVAAMAEVVIPRTDTPGATDAGVARFIEAMVAEWLDPGERAIFDAGLADLETRIPDEYGAPFDELDARQQLRILEDLESAASDSPWYDFGNVQRDFVSDAPFICQIKELTVWGFFTSEIGATQVLRPNPMPAEFEGDVPLPEGASSWVNWI